MTHLDTHSCIQLENRCRDVLQIMIQFKHADRHTTDTYCIVRLSCIAVLYALNTVVYTIVQDCCGSWCCWCYTALAHIMTTLPVHVSFFFFDDKCWNYKLKVYALLSNSRVTAQRKKLHFTHHVMRVKLDLCFYVESTYVQIHALNHSLGHSLTHTSSALQLHATATQTTTTVIGPLRKILFAASPSVLNVVCPVNTLTSSAVAVWPESFTARYLWKRERIGQGGNPQ